MTDGSSEMFTLARIIHDLRLASDVVDLDGTTGTEEFVTMPTWWMLPADVGRKSRRADGSHDLVPHRLTGPSLVPLADIDQPVTLSTESFGRSDSVTLDVRVEPDASSSPWSLELPAGSGRAPWPSQPCTATDLEVRGTAARWALTEIVEDKCRRALSAHVAATVASVRDASMVYGVRGSIPKGYIDEHALADATTRLTFGEDDSDGLAATVCRSVLTQPFTKVEPSLWLTRTVNFAAKRFVCRWLSDPIEGSKVRAAIVAGQPLDGFGDALIRRALEPELARVLTPDTILDHLDDEP